MITAKLIIGAGKVTPNSTINPLLGQNGIPVDAFCKQATEEVRTYEDGVPVRIRVKKRNNTSVAGQVAGRQSSPAAKQGASSFELYVKGPVHRVLIERLQLSVVQETQSTETSGGAVHIPGHFFELKVKDFTGGFTASERFMTTFSSEDQVQSPASLSFKKPLAVVTVEQIYGLAARLLQDKQVDLNGSRGVVQVACQLLSRAHALGVRVLLTDLKDK